MMQGFFTVEIYILLSEYDSVVPSCRYASAVEHTESLDWTGCLWKSMIYT